MKLFKTVKSTSFMLLIFVLASFFTGTGLTAAQDEGIAKLEKGLLPAVLIKGDTPWTLKERMAHYKVPGVSIAVIKDYKVLWSGGFGVKESGSTEPVTASTLFQAASVSKPVAAMAALKLVQEGKLALDKNINGLLKNWKLPENQFTANNPVTLKHVLSHSGGTTVHGFRGYSEGEKVPTLIQSLDGKKPANSAPVRVDQVPGSFRYSGGGFSVMQQILVDTVKQPFPIIMEDTVLKPIGMTHSTYLQPLPADKVKFAASGHRPGGLVLTGKRHTYPEMAAAGLWTNAGDMARFAAELQSALDNKSNKVLSQKTAKLMLTPYNSSSMGLGIMVNNDRGTGYFGHSGANEGFRIRMTASMEGGYGAVVMVNSDDGMPLINEIIRGIAHIYKWQGALPKVYEIKKMTAEKLATFTGKYDVDSDHLLAVTFEEGRLYAQVTASQKAELLAVSDDTFIRRDQQVNHKFITDPKTGGISQLIINRNGMSRVYERKDDDYTVPLELLLANKIPEAQEAYRKLWKESPQDQNVSGMRMLYLVEDLMKKAHLQGALTILHLTAEFHPGLIKSMVTTLNTEIRNVMKNPALPPAAKQQIKASYNMMLKKLGLKELE